MAGATFLFLFFFFLFLRFYIDALELFHVASGLESIEDKLIHLTCQHGLNLIKIDLLTQSEFNEDWFEKENYNNYTII